MWPFSRKPKEETRSSGGGFTAQIMAARNTYIGGQEGIAELTATVQSAVSLWEGGLSLADVAGTDILDRRTLALTGRSLALRGEAVYLIREQGLIAVSDWDMTTRDTRPKAYRCSVAEIGGGKTVNALAGEVLHFRTGCNASAPYFGTAPLRRAQLSAGLLQTVETALAEVFENAPLGSSVIPMPESPETDMTELARKFRGFRGRVLVRESVNVTAAGGPAPQTDLKPSDVSPDLSKAMTKETLSAAKESINGVFGVLPGLNNPATTGPLVREAQRHLGQWVLQPMAEMMAEECTQKLGNAISLDVMRPLQAFDAGGRARAMAGVVQALAMAKEAGVDPSLAMKFVDMKGAENG